MDERPVIELNPRFVVDEHGNRHSVVLSISEYEQLMELIEDHNDALALDHVVDNAEGLIDLDEVEADITQSLSG